MEFNDFSHHFILPLDIKTVETQSQPTAVIIGFATSPIYSVKKQQVSPTFYLTLHM
jgi:hypothetical protein